MFGLVVPLLKVTIGYILTRLNFFLDFFDLFKILLLLLRELNISLMLLFLLVFLLQFFLSLFVQNFFSLLLRFRSLVDFKNLFVRFDGLSIEVIWSENWNSFFFEFMNSLLNTSKCLIVKMELSKNLRLNFLSLIFIDLRFGL